MRKTLNLILLVTCCFFAVQLCWGQTSNQGAIVGTIKDPNDNVIPLVNVKITNNETGVSKTTTTDERGNYRVDFLQPGSYQILAEANGFKKMEVSKVTVQVSEIQRTDIKMEVGQVNEEVSVSMDGQSQVDTETPTRGEVITERTIQNMPLNGREFLELSALVPGAESGNQKNGVFPTKGTAIGFNGNRSGYNAFYVDGADSTDSYFNQLIASPALDAVKEFRVETSLYSARYGRAGGGIVNVVTKSGTNKFSGTLYEFHRNKALDALPYFQTSGRNATPPYRFNQFGGTIGGPIFKNKTFFFFSTEFFRQTKPGNLIEGFAPSALEREGNFTQSINGYTQGPVTLVNPYCTAPCTQATIASKILPANLINPLGQKLMALIPNANYNDPIMNIRVFRSGKAETEKYLLKIDHNFKDGSTLNGSFNWGDYDSIVPGLIEFADQNNFDYSKTIALGYTRTFTKNLVSDTKFNFSISNNGTNQAQLDKNYAKEFGFWTGTTLKPDQVGFPRVQLYTFGNRFMQLGGQGRNERDNRTWYFREDMVWIKGTHTLSFGGDFKAQDYGWLYDTHYLGAYYIGFNDGASGQNTNYRVTGHTLASLLTGISAYTQYQYGDSQLARSERNSIGLYIQDDWKITPRLTLNIGLRYDYEPAFKAKNGKFMTLDFQTGLPWYCSEVDQTLLKDLKYKYETGGPCRGFKADTLNFAPRIGFAFGPFNDNNTVLRGGYGMVYTSENMYTTGYGSFIAPFGGTFLWRTRSPFQPDLQNHLVPMDQAPFNLPLTSPDIPGSLFLNPEEYPTGNVQHWNLGLSRNIGWGVVMETAYVGSKGTNLNGLSTLANYNRPVYNKVIANIPTFTTINLRLKGFNSSYHSFQAKATKRFKDGFSFLASYTWAHALAEASNDQVDENTDIDTDETGVATVRRIWSNADFDIRHRFSLSGTYDLPFGKGRMFGNHWNSWVNGFLGGWRVNMISTYQTGYPFSVRTSTGRVPDRICDGNLPADKRTVDVWFDYKCFPDHVGKVSGRDLNGNAPPNIIRGPDFLNFDFGIHKEIRTTESTKIQLRGEVFNAFNRPNLFGPSVNNFITPAPTALPGTGLTGAKITRQRDNRDIQLAIKFIF